MLHTCSCSCSILSKSCFLGHCIIKQLLYLSSPSETIHDCKISTLSKKTRFTQYAAAAAASMQHFAAFAFLYKQATPLPKFSLWNNPWFQNFMQLCPRKAYYLVCCSCSCKYAALCCNCRIELASNSSAWVLPLKQSLIAKFHPTLCKEIGLIHYAATAAANMQQYAAIDALYKQVTPLSEFSLWNNPRLQNFMQLFPRKQDLLSMLQLQLQVCSIFLHLPHSISKQPFYLSFPSETIPDCKISCDSVQEISTYSVWCSCSYSYKNAA